MPNYQNGKVYMIWADNERYYGSTVNTLPRRFSAHKGHHKSGHTTTVSILFNKYGIENCKIELVELFPCNSKMELEAREGFYIRGNDCVNKRIPCRTEEEIKERDRVIKKNYHEAHKEEHKEYLKKYYEEHKEEHKERGKKHYEEHKEEYKQRAKEWRELNKEKVKAYKEAHKEEAKQKRKERDAKKREALIK